MREHVKTGLIEALIQIFSPVRVNSRIRPDRGRFSIATAVNEYGYHREFWNVQECIGLHTAGFVNE